MTGVTAPKRLRLPFPHPGQRIVREQARRFNFVSAGRRWRKTTLFMAIAAEGAVKRQRWIWGAPTYDQTRVAMAELKQAASDVADFNLSRMEAEFKGGGRVLFRSLDNPDNVRGHTADGVVIDEAGFVAEAAWFKVLRPMLMDTGGVAWIGGTPKGRNWFWREFIAAADRDDSIAWQAPTLGVKVIDKQLVRVPHPLENPHIPFTEIEQMWRTMPEALFRQEVLAEFIEDAGAVFRNVRGCVDPLLNAAHPNGGAYYGGLDWAQQNDFTVCVVMDAAGRVVALDRFNQVDWSTQYGRVKVVTEKWRIARGLAEMNSIGSPNLEALHRGGLAQWRGFTTTQDTKSEIIQALSLAFERGEIRIPDNPVLIAELEAYEMDRLPSGRWRYGAPDGMHDDTVIALALAWWSKIQGPRASIQRLQAEGLYSSQSKPGARTRTGRVKAEPRS